MVGERLFKAVKATGSKGAVRTYCLLSLLLSLRDNSHSLARSQPRITIALLDSEPLRPLAHLINYPEVLKEKVALHVTPPASSNK